MDLEMKKESAAGKGESVVYQPDEVTRLEVKVEDETVWLNRSQLALLFGRDVKTIGKHINNALREELRDIAVVANFATTAADGKVYSVAYYNLDMILSVGYRVNSKNAVIFRRWANSVLKEHLLRGFTLNHRFSSLEKTFFFFNFQISLLLGPTYQKKPFYLKTKLECLCIR